MGRVAIAVRCKAVARKNGAGQRNRVDERMRALARIAAARKAALMAPALPMARVPTGMPAGICAIDSKESRPFRARDWMGTPRTGREICAATSR